MMARVLYLYNDKPKELGVFHGCLLLRSPPRDARARLLAWPLAKSLLATATAFRRQRRTAERRARAPAYARGRGHHSPPRASAPAASDLPPPSAASAALVAAAVPICGRAAAGRRAAAAGRRAGRVGRVGRTARGARAAVEPPCRARPRIQTGAIRNASLRGVFSPGPLSSAQLA